MRTSGIERARFVILDQEGGDDGCKPHDERGLIEGQASPDAKHGHDATAAVEAQEGREGVTEGGHDGKPEELARGEAEEPAGGCDGEERLGEIEKEHAEAEWPATDAEGVGGPWVVVRLVAWVGGEEAFADGLHPNYRTTGQVNSSIATK